MWYKYCICITDARSGTIIGINTIVFVLQMPKVEFKSNAKPSTYAYPPHLEEKKENKKDKVETAVLSITAKQKKKEAEKKKDEEKMEVVCTRKKEI